MKTGLPPPVPPTTFVKRRPGAPEGFYAAEAAGLRWLGEAGAVAVPEVLSVTPTSITLRRIVHGTPTAAGAEALGCALADLHAFGAPGFGAPWPGFIGPLPMDNGPAAGSGWASFYAERRVMPYVRLATDRRALEEPDRRAVEALLGRIKEVAGGSDGEPPRRIHGDLWSGNVVWDRCGAGWLVDPAAHGGHRETDLAMLALFGAPHLDRLVASYDEHFPLADGWRDRVGLHQLHPLLVHAALFGGAYGARAGAAARHPGRPAR